MHFYIRQYTIAISVKKSQCHGLLGNQIHVLNTRILSKSYPRVTIQGEQNVNSPLVIALDDQKMDKKKFSISVKFYV